jgi:hypothetical protein
MRKYHLEVFLCLFSLKTIIYTTLSLAMVTQQKKVRYLKLLTKIEFLKKLKILALFSLSLLLTEV